MWADHVRTLFCLFYFHCITFKGTGQRNLMREWIQRKEGEMEYFYVPFFLVTILAVLQQTKQDKSESTADPSLHSRETFSPNERVCLTGNQGGEILLPCTCEERNSLKEFKWQIENPLSLVLKFKQENRRYGQNYKTRVTTYLHESDTNCSLLLRNITENDSKNYSCRFTKNEQYQIVYLCLKVNQISPTDGVSAIHDSKDDITPTEKNPSRMYFAILPVIALLLVVGVLRNLKQRRVESTHSTTQPPLRTSTEEVVS